EQQASGGGGGGGGWLDATPLGFIDAGPEGARFETIPDPEAPVRMLKGGATALATIVTTIAGVRALRARRRGGALGGGSRGLLGREDVEVGERGGARQRVAGVRVAVEERAELGERAEEALVDRLGGQRGGEREVAAGQALGQAQQVGLDALLLTGEHRPRAAE